MESIESKSNIPVMRALNRRTRWTTRPPLPPLPPPPPSAAAVVSQRRPHGYAQSITRDPHKCCSSLMPVFSFLITFSFQTMKRRLPCRTLIYVCTRGVRCVCVVISPTDNANCLPTHNISYGVMRIPIPIFPMWAKNRKLRRHRPPPSSSLGSSCTLLSCHSMA